MHVQFFGEEREHGWVGNNWLMAYKGLAAFEAEAAINSSMKVKPSRRVAWNVAVSAAEQAVHLDRLDRIHLLTYLYEPVPQKTTSSPKKQKRPYRRTSAKTSPVGGSKNFMDISACSQDDASPPRKRCRRKSSLPLKPDSDGVSDGCVPSSTTDGDMSLTAVNNATSLESESAAENSLEGKD